MQAFQPLKLFSALRLNDQFARDTDDIVTFQSVILAGVTDVKHLKSKIRDEDQHNGKGERQIIEYLDRLDLETGYMLSLSFNQKKTGSDRATIGDKTLFEETV